MFLCSEEQTLLVKIVKRLASVLNISRLKVILIYTKIQFIPHREHRALTVETTVSQWCIGK